MKVEPTRQAAHQVDRHLDPHLRGKHVRTIRGREFPVRASIVNAELAQQQRRLAALTKALQLAQSQAPVGRRGSTPACSTPATDPQLDLLVELQNTIRRRGAQILDERLTGYARLTLDEAGHLAVARVRVAVAEVADSGAATPIAQLLREDLERLESLLFAWSLGRLPPDDVEAVRQVTSERSLIRIPSISASPCAFNTAVGESQPSIEACKQANEESNERERSRG